MALEPMATSLPARMAAKFLGFLDRGGQIRIREKHYASPGLEHSMPDTVALPPVYIVRYQPQAWHFTRPFLGNADGAVF